MKKLIIMAVAAVLALGMASCAKSPEKMAEKANATYIKTLDKHLCNMEELVEKMDSANYNDIDLQLQGIDSLLTAASDEWTESLNQAMMKKFDLKREDLDSLEPTDEMQQWISDNVMTQLLKDSLTSYQNRIQNIVYGAIAKEASYMSGDDDELYNIDDEELEYTDSVSME